MENLESGGVVDIEEMTRHERNVLLEETLNEMYTRLDMARRSGVDIETIPDGRSPFRLEDEAPQEQLEGLTNVLKSVLEKIRQEPIAKSENVNLHQFVSDNLNIKASVFGDEESHTKLMADLIITTLDSKVRKTELQLLISDVGTEHYALEIEFPDDEDYEGLTYSTNDALKDFSAEEFIVASDVGWKAFDVVCGSAATDLQS